MAKVWIILEGDGYENRIVGACSSKEKTDLTVAAMKHIGGYDNDLFIEEYELDKIFSKANELLEKTNF